MCGDMHISICALRVSTIRMMKSCFWTGKRNGPAATVEPEPKPRLP